MATIRGNVVSVTEDGDLVTDISESALDGAPRDESVNVRCAGHRTVGIYPADHGQPEMTFIACVATDGLLRLSLVGDDASRFLGIGVGDEVTLQW